MLASNDIVYVSSAGNAGQRHYQGDYYNDGYDFHDFSRGSEPVYKYLYVNIPNNGEVTVVLQWNDKFGSSGNDYDLYLFDTADWSILARSIYIQDGDDDPLEAFSYTNTGGSTIDAEIDVYNYNGTAATKTLEVFIYPRNSAWVYVNNIDPTDSIFGHPAVPGAIAVGAIDANDPGNDDIEPFSSQGPVTITYPSPVSRSKPDLCGIDGVTVTGAGGFPVPFYGTSAAAPHIAAIAAQLWGAFPEKTANEIRTMLNSSAVDLGSSGYDYVYGYGRADALSAFPIEDTEAPKYSHVSVNNTVAGQPTLFSAYWTDNVALSGYIFATNNTGTWVNDSFVSMSGTANWSNVTKILNSTVGITIGWRIYANDTTGNWNDTGIQTLITVAPAYGVDLTVEGAKTAAKPTVAGVNATYVLTVNNTGNVADNYTLVVENPDGATTAVLSGNVTSIDAYTYKTVDIASGESVIVLLNVTNETARAEPFRVNVTANSTGDPGKTDYINTTTTVGPTQTYTVNGTGEINATVIADTNVSYNTTAPVNITIGKYPVNPGTAFAGDIGKYIDVSVDNATRVTNLTIKLFYTDAELKGMNESALKMYWWNGTTWSVCSNTGVNTTDQNNYNGYIWTFINSTTTPSLNDLTGTPFAAAGETAYGVELTVEPTMLIPVLPSENATFTLIVKNTGTLNDTFNPDN